MPIFSFTEYTLMELFSKPGNWRQYTLIRRGYSASKRLVKLTIFKKFPIKAVWISRYIFAIVFVCCIIIFNTFPAKTSTRVNVEKILIVNVHQHCFDADIWLKMKGESTSFIDVVSTLAKQRWNNVDRITSIQRR